MHEPLHCRGFAAARIAARLHTAILAPGCFFGESQDQAYVSEGKTRGGVRSLLYMTKHHHLPFWYYSAEACFPVRGTESVLSHFNEYLSYGCTVLLKSTNDANLINRNLRLACDWIAG